MSPIRIVTMEKQHVSWEAPQVPAFQAVSSKILQGVASAFTLSYNGGDTLETLYPFLVKDYLDRDLRVGSERKRNQGDRHH